MEWVWPTQNDVTADSNEDENKNSDSTEPENLMKKHNLFNLKTCTTEPVDKLKIRSSDIINSMDSYSWEADSCSSDQEIPRTLCNSEVSLFYCNKTISLHKILYHGCLK